MQQGQQIDIDDLQRGKGSQRAGSLSIFIHGRLYTFHFPQPIPYLIILRNQECMKGIWHF